MDPTKDFKEFFALLNRNDVKYLLVGGYAFSIHAEPRYTKDMDIFFDGSTENAAKLLKALNQFGFSSLNITIEDLTKPERIIQLGYPPNRIDLMNVIEGVSFERAWGNKINTRYLNEPVHVIGKDDLIANKKAAGRKQDLVDVEKLKKM